MKAIALQVLNRLLVEAIEQRSRSGEIHVFDFDDTLVKTKSKVHVTSHDNMGNEIKKSLNPKEYAQYKRQANDAFDYSDFEDVIEPEPIQPMMLNLRKSIQNLGINNVFILTARSNPMPIRMFLNAQGIPEIRIFAIGSSAPEAKANVIKNELMSRNNINGVTFYDDVAKNAAAVRALRDNLRGIKNVNIKTIVVRS